MSSFVVEGGHKLSGTIRPQGAKNEALQVISAVLLTKEEVTILNIPEILDVRNLILLLESMGVKVKRHEKVVYTFKAQSSILTAALCPGSTTAILCITW